MNIRAKFPLRYTGIFRDVYGCCSYSIAAEQKARSTYEYLIDLTDDPDVLSPLRFLREREIVHFQRFGEALDIVRDDLAQEKTFIMNRPEFMKNNGK